MQCNKCGHSFGSRLETIFRIVALAALCW